MGVISDPPPDTARALKQSKELGLLVDNAIIGDIVSNLDIYFSQWMQQ
jgi:hypothetical protein